MVDKYMEFILKNYKKIVLLFVIASIILGLLGILKLGINPDLTNIVKKGETKYSMLVDFLKKKASTNNLVVAMYTKGDVEGAKKALKVLKEKFENSGYVKYAVRFDAPELVVKYGIFSLNREGFNNIIGYLEKLRTGTSQSIVDFHFWRNLGVVLSEINTYMGEFVKRKGFNEYILVSPSGNLILMTFALKVSASDVGNTAKSIVALKKIANEIKREYGFDIKFTGGPMTTYESQLQVKKDFIYTTILSLVLISLLLYLTLGSIYSVFLLFLSMLSSMGISLGVYYILFRQINIVTSFVNAMVLGLGIDFGIHISSRVISKRRSKLDMESSIKFSIAEAFYPSLISGTTTAIAFLVMILTKSPALSQMGIMTAVGIAIYFLVMFLFLPSLYLLIKVKPRHFRIYDLLIMSADRLRRKKSAAVGVLVIALVLAYFGYRNAINYWYTPPGLISSNSESSQVWEDIKKSFKSVGLGDIAVAVEKFEDLENVENKLKESGMFSSVSSIIDVIGDLSEESTKRVKRFYGDLSTIVRDPIASTIFRRVGLYHDLIDMLRLISTSKDFNSILSEIEKDIPMFFYSYKGKRYFLIFLESKVDLYSNNNVKYVMETLYKMLPENKILGYPPLLYFVMKDARELITRITIYILIFIFGILLISVRKFYPALQMVLITILSIMATFGIASFMNIHVSFMTLLMVPIMLGIGIDGMIHIYHTVNTGKESIVQTEKAVSISLLTTIIAFGSFALARGGLLKEFGICVSVGLFVSLVLSIFVFLPMIERRKKDV